MTSHLDDNLNVIKNAELTKEQEKLRLRNEADLKKILSLPEGRRFIWRQIGECHIFRSAFNLNTKLEDFQLGQQDRGLALLNEVNAVDPNMFAQLQREWISEQNSKKEKAKS
jgi:hypothetical protein